MISDKISEEMFFNPFHSLVWEIMNNISSDPNKTIDLVTVPTELLKHPKTSNYNHLDVVNLASNVNSASNIENHALLLAEMSIERNLYSLNQETLNIISRGNIDVIDELDEFQSKFNKILKPLTNKTAISHNKLMKDVFVEIEEKINQKKKGDVVGMSTGLNCLDSVLGGWKKQKSYIIAGRPGMGKTSLVLVTSWFNAWLQKKPVAFFSLEMSAEELMRRIMSINSEVPYKLMDDGMLESFEVERIQQTSGKYSNAPLYIDDTPALTIQQIRARSHRLKHEKGVELIIIDYLQLIKGGKIKAGNREQEVSQISQTLKQISKELDVPVVALAQLSRAVETRGGDKRPQLSDLRESGSIEQDADSVMFIYRPEYYGITEDEAGDSLEGKAEIIIAKNRGGDTDNVQCQTQMAISKFSDIEIQDNYQPMQERSINDFPDVENNFY